MIFSYTTSAISVDVAVVDVASESLVNVVAVDDYELTKGGDRQLFLGDGVDRLEKFHVLRSDGGYDANSRTKVLAEVYDIARFVGAQLKHDDIKRELEVDFALHVP